jgi:hypothetical protein
LVTKLIIKTFTNIFTRVVGSSFRKLLNLERIIRMVTFLKLLRIIIRKPLKNIIRSMWCMQELSELTSIASLSYIKWTPSIAHSNFLSYGYHSLPCSKLVTCWPHNFFSTFKIFFMIGWRCYFLNLGWRILSLLSTVKFGLGLINMT